MSSDLRNECGRLPDTEACHEEDVSVLGDNLIPPTTIPSGALHRAHSELATKQRIIDDVLQHLQKCMKENSDLHIQHEVAQSKLRNQQIETEKLRKTCSWYKTQLYDAQTELRGRTSAQDEETRRLKADREKVNVHLLKTLSECEILNERLRLEQSKRCDCEKDESPRTFRHESKDSGIFSESSTSDTSSEVIDAFSCDAATPQNESQSKEIDQLRQEVATHSSLCLQLTLDKEKLVADREMWRQQSQYQDTLLSVQNKNLDQLQEELQRANKATQAKRKEHETAVDYLTKCRQQMDQLMRENGEIHRESMQMIMRFERIVSILQGYRQEIREKEERIRFLTLPKSINMVRSTQTNAVIGLSSCDKGMQTRHTALSSPASSSSSSMDAVNYHKNLLKVIEREYQQKLRQREVNTRTLMKRLREEMRNGKEQLHRYQQLKDSVRVFMQRVLLSPGGRRVELPSEGGMNSDEMLLQTLKNMANPREEEKDGGGESSQSVIMECKSCDSEEASKTIAQLEVECSRLRKQREDDVAQVAALHADLVSKTICAEESMKTIEALEMEQQALHYSLDMLKQKFLEMEKQVLEHAKYKDTAESERVQHHQMMLLLLQIKNERDDLMLQNERLNKLMRGLLLGQEKGQSVATKANETLKRCAKYQVASPMIGAISENIHSLQQEIKSLNSAILWRERGEMSLLDELQVAIAEDRRPFL